MQVRILDLDGSLSPQSGLGRFQPPVLAARHWGPYLRLAIEFGRFRAFERAVGDWLESGPPGPSVTLIGSGDFHHVTLAFLRRLRTPFNLLVLDNHPDWVRGAPVLHCGTWLYHAAGLPNLRKVFHAGGDVDFDNAWRHLAPWSYLREGKIVVFPAVRAFRAGPWPHIAHEPLRHRPGDRVDAERMADLLGPHRLELARHPLYISVDKDVMRPADAVANWDSGHLDLAETAAIVAAFREAANHEVIGADVVGDWSPVQARGFVRQLLHWTEHPALKVDPVAAQHINERANLALLQALGATATAVEKLPRRLRAA